jgi:hypothetical protein
MYLAYFDESGDDGYPATSSPLFVQTAIYLHHRQWKPAFEATRQFRRDLAKRTRLAPSIEWHTRELLLDKDPYHPLRLTTGERIGLVTEFCRQLASLEVKRISVVIDKSAIKTPEYRVLDKAVTYLIQRIENDLLSADGRFAIITDAGRIGKMRATARRIQRINFIPSKFGPEPQRSEIKSLIEDPLPKKSHESYFIQFADLVAALVELHMRKELGVADWPNRLASYVSTEDVRGWLAVMRPRFNPKASPSHPLGVVRSPSTERLLRVALGRHRRRKRDLRGSSGGKPVHACGSDAHSRPRIRPRAKPGSDPGTGSPHPGFGGRSTAPSSRHLHHPVGPVLGRRPWRGARGPRRQRAHPAGPGGITAEGRATASLRPRASRRGRSCWRVDPACR